jgi:hypothetical protein
MQTTDFARQLVDVEAGYSGANWRLNAGLCGFHFFQHLSYDAPTLAAYYQREVYGVGPKVGVDGRIPLGTDPVCRGRRQCSPAG